MHPEYKVVTHRLSTIAICEMANEKGRNGYSTAFFRLGVKHRALTCARKFFSIVINPCVDCPVYLHVVRQ